MNKFRYIGNEDSIVAAKDILREYPATVAEDKVRALVQEAMSKPEWPDKVDVLYDGNKVYPLKPIISDVDNCIKNGMEQMTQKLYVFLHTCTGSIAHYDKAGWVATYPTVAAFAQYCRCNEQGRSILDQQPWWASDRKAICKEILNMVEGVV